MSDFDFTSRLDESNTQTITLRGPEIPVFNRFLSRAAAQLALTEAEKQVFAPFVRGAKILEPDPVPELDLPEDQPLTGAEQRAADSRRENPTMVFPPAPEYSFFLQAIQDKINETNRRIELAKRLYVWVPSSPLPYTGNGS